MVSNKMVVEIGKEGNKTVTGTSKPFCKSSNTLTKWLPPRLVQQQITGGASPKRECKENQKGTISSDHPSIDQLVATCCKSYRKLYPSLIGVDISSLVHKIVGRFIYIRNEIDGARHLVKTNVYLDNGEKESSADSFIDDSDIELFSDSESSGDTSGSELSGVWYVDETGCLH